jgi:hypothetical protein
MDLVSGLQKYPTAGKKLPSRRSDDSNSTMDMESTQPCIPCVGDSIWTALVGSPDAMDLSGMHLLLQSNGQRGKDEVQEPKNAENHAVVMQKIACGYNPPLGCHCTGLGAFTSIFVCSTRETTSIAKDLRIIEPS